MKNENNCGETGNSCQKINFAKTLGQLLKQKPVELHRKLVIWMIKYTSNFQKVKLITYLSN